MYNNVNCYNKIISGAEFKKILTFLILSWVGILFILATQLLEKVTKNVRG